MIAAVVALVAMAGFDLIRAPERQWSAGVAVATIGAYRRTFAPLLESAGVRCRFDPSCSRYADTVIRRFGMATGSWLALRRVVKCGPWTPAGTVDPPPAAASG